MPDVDLALARQRMTKAKAAFTEAARLALAGAPDATERVNAALREVNEAMAALRALDAAERAKA